MLIKKALIIFCIFAGLIVPVVFVFAATTGYAWSENIGWINFGCTNCNVQVSDTRLTGYAWNENYGWISLSCSNTVGGCTSSNWGVVNTTSGALSGYAWGENTGWVNFTGVAINSANDCSIGKFVGQATGDVVGTIQFNGSCTNCNLTTDWHPSCGGSMSYSLTTSVLPVSHGVVSPSSGSFSPGASVNLTATPDPGYVFSSWSGDLTGIENPKGITIDSNKSVTANFTFSACPVNLRLNSSTGDCVACISNSDCGTDSYASDSAFCQDGNVYKNYTAYTCSDAGTKSSVCSSSTSAKLIETCISGKTCYNGSCQTVVCASNSSCGVDGYTGSLFCQDGNVYQNYITYTCSNPGAGNSVCLSPTEAKLKTTCSADETCKDGVCKVEKHNMCSEQQCVSVGGAGPDECQADNDCKSQYFECRNLKCVSVNGIGINQCADDSNCATPKHNECQNQQCVVVDGADSNQCLTNNDCNPSAPVSGGIGGSQAFHSECNEQQQCVSLPGEGFDKCHENNDCGVVQQAIQNAVMVPVQAVVEVAQKIAEPVRAAAVETQKIINTPEGSAVTKTISTVGVVSGAAAVTSVAVFAPASVLEFFLIPMRLFGLLMAGVGLRKKIVPWGVVYDSVTKQPIDPAYVVLKDEKGNEVASGITDIDGRYGFFVKPGVYYISARKTNYAFPSQKLAGKINDELYSDLYSGEKIEIKKEGGVITKNIPMDPLKFDWNEFAKKNKSFMKFYSRGDVWIKKTTNFIFNTGFFVAIVALFAAPYPYNMIIVGLYMLLLLLRMAGLKPRSLGHIIDKITKTPLSFSIVRVMMPETNVEISHQIADKYGRYYCLVPKGKYYVKIEKKNNDGSYSLVYTSLVTDASKKGIIKETFAV